MIKQFCDRCKCEIGVELRVGIKRIDKWDAHQIGAITAVMGRGTDFAVCDACLAELKRMISVFLDNDRRLYGCATQESMF